MILLVRFVNKGREPLTQAQTGHVDRMDIPMGTSFFFFSWDNFVSFTKYLA